MFDARTADFQDVAVGATITYWYADPSIAARSIGFSIDTETGQWLSDQRLAETSILVIGVRVVSIKPQAELASVLETPVREQAQQDADKATFELRAMAVERERAIAEDEMQSKIGLAKREELLVGQEVANALKRAKEAAASEKARSESAAENVRVTGAAAAEAKKVRLAAFDGIESEVLLALAANPLAENRPEIRALNRSPYVLSQALSRIAGAQKD